MPSSDRKLELKTMTSVAQIGSQPAVYSKGLTEAPREGERTALALIALLLGKTPPPVLIGLKWFIDSILTAYFACPAWSFTVCPLRRIVRMIKTKGMGLAAWEKRKRRKKCV
jgi:hypothetical protein